MKRTVCILWLASILPCAAHAVAEPRLPALEDMLSMRNVFGLAIAPDGARVVYALRVWEDGRDGNKKSVSHLWIANAGEPESARQITFGDRGESAAAWSPDGRFISFLASRGTGDDDSGAQLWLLPVDGGEPTRVTAERGGVSAYAWAPDARRVAFVSRPPLEAPQEDSRRRGDDAEVFEEQLRYSHLSVIETTSRQVTRLISGTEFTVREDLSWAPDGRTIAFTRAKTPLPRDMNLEIALVDVEARTVKVISPPQASSEAPAWSPRGDLIAFVSAPNPNPPKRDGVRLPNPGATYRLMVHHVADGRVTNLSRSRFDHSPARPFWSPDGTRLLFVAGRGVYRDAIEYDFKQDEFTSLTTERVVSLYGVSRTGRVCFVQESAAQAPDVYVADDRFERSQRTTDANPHVRGLLIGPTEVVHWESDGHQIEGILLKPRSLQPGRRYPLMVVLHGGPTASILNTFRVGYGDGGQHWAGQGWLVLYPNYRGSTNYGERFAMLNTLDWGGGDMRDVVRGVDYLVRDGIADPRRVSVQGWSYGGYLAGWLVSQTDRFTSAVVGAGISNLASMYGTSDMPDYLAAFFGGSATQENIAEYSRRSIISHSSKVSAPVLILHGANDRRVPSSQALELFRALRDQGKTAELVTYPRAGHGLEEYYHQLDRMKRQFEWVNRFATQSGTASAKHQQHPR
jgi:dipeptidyl aminopeptidase/acylaminoacyl peptidase